MELLNKGCHMKDPIFQSFFLLAGVLSLAACDHDLKRWGTPAMSAPTPRVQLLFEKTKTICFGRFLVDIPVSSTVAWGDAAIPLGIEIYPNEADKMKILAGKFIDELKSVKAIYHDHVPLLISDEDVSELSGKIVTGYENFVSINALKINGYFSLNSDGVIIRARPLMGDRDPTVAVIKSIALRLRQRADSDIPLEPGNCIESAFLPDERGIKKEILEHIRIGLRLKEFSDAHFSIYVAPANPDDPESDSLERQWKRIKEDPGTPEGKKALGATKFFRESPREIHDWKTGYEVLTREPDEEGSHSHHDFQIKFIGVPHDPYKPYADIQFQTGVADNAAGATKPSLTDEEAIAVWDKIVSTIRVRPTSAAPVKTADTDPGPRLPLGELAATGRTCPQTGWWEPDEASQSTRSQRQHLEAGERMPHVVSSGEPSLWQKLKGEQPTYRTATIWRLVSYDDAPTTASSALASAPGKDDGNTAEKKG